MKKVIIQHCLGEHQALFNLSRPINEDYAKHFDFEYIADNVQRCPNRQIWWEKIAFIRSLLPTLEEGTLVVWEDSDSINMKTESFENALPENFILGMVQNRTGLNCSELAPWYNAGIIVFRNVAAVRDFFDRVWDRPEQTDEQAMVAELRLHNWEVGGGIKIHSMHPKWNRWKCHEHIFTNPNVQSFHGMPFAKKLVEMTKFVQSL